MIIKDLLKLSLTNACNYNKHEVRKKLTFLLNDEQQQH